MLTRPDSEIEELLSQSVEQYRVLLENVERLLKSLDECEYSQLKSYALSLHQLQIEARRQDDQLLPLLIADFTNWKDNALYKLRLEYIESILKYNELLVPKMRGVMAVISVELKNMSGGRNALAGYALKNTQQRGLRGIG